MTKEFVQIEMMLAAHGDCIWLEYGSDTCTRRILIDGGPIGQYKFLDAKISALQAGDANFELIVLTHVDTDHVDGLVRLFAEKRSDWKFGTDQVWFNGWEHLDVSALGGKQGDYFSALIRARLELPKWNSSFGGKAVVVPDMGTLPRVSLADDFIITLLSPTPQKLSKMKEAWEDDVKGSFQAGDLEAAWKALATQKKYLPCKTLLGSASESEIDTAVAKQSTPDNAAANGSSIAFLAEFRGMSALFLGDAHADVVADSIDRLLSERGKSTLDVDAVKVAHHGSKGNTSDRLLELIRSPNFLVSTNGAMFKHPDEEAIHRIISRSLHDCPTLYFNYRTKFNNIWDDDRLRKELSYKTIYNESDTDALAVRLQR